jgi:cytidylate kinase
MKITIGGMPGSGKSTVADFIAEKLNIKRYSGGDFMRELARKKGVSLLELSRQAEDSFEVDEAIDKMYDRLREEDNFIIDSRLGFYFLKDSLKIFLKVTEEIAAKRIFMQKRAIEQENLTLERTLQNIKRRQASERLRYKKYYGIDIDDMSNYDIVVDTSDMNAKQMNENVLKAIDKYDK